MAPVYVNIPAHGKIFIIKDTLKNATAIYGENDFNNNVKESGPFTKEKPL